MFDFEVEDGGTRDDRAVCGTIGFGEVRKTITTECARDVVGRGCVWQTDHCAQIRDARSVEEGVVHQDGQVDDDGTCFWIFEGVGLWRRR